MTLILTTLFFILGLVIGSFLNVVISRYNSGRSLKGRSACMSCRSQLSWYELIPLFSFIGLLGRCKNCKVRISRFYPVVELVTGIIFAALYLKLSGIVDPLEFLFTFKYYAFLFSILIVISAYDLRHKIIPDLLSLLLFVFSFIGIFLFTPYGFFPHVPALPEFFTGIFMALPFFLLWLISKGTWMGLGDAKLALGLGYLLGAGKVVTALMFSFWSGAIIGIILIMFKKGYGMRSEIPFAPFLVLGSILAFFFEFMQYAIF